MKYTKRLEEINQRQSTSLRDAFDREEKLTRENADLREKVVSQQREINALTLEIDRILNREREQ